MCVWFKLHLKICERKEHGEICDCKSTNYNTTPLKGIPFARRSNLLMVKSTSTDPRYFQTHEIIPWPRLTCGVLETPPPIRMESFITGAHHCMCHNFSCSVGVHQTRTHARGENTVEDDSSGRITYFSTSLLISACVVVTPVNCHVPPSVCWGLCRRGSCIILILCVWLILLMQSDHILFRLSVTWAAPVLCHFSPVFLFRRQPRFETGAEVSHAASPSDLLLSSSWSKIRIYGSYSAFCTAATEHDRLLLSYSTTQCTCMCWVIPLICLPRLHVGISPNPGHLLPVSPTQGTFLTPLLRR